MVTLDVRLAYRDDTVSEWTELAHSFEQRKLSCNLTISKVSRHLNEEKRLLFLLALVTFSLAIRCLAVLLADHGQRGPVLRV